MNMLIVDFDRERAHRLMRHASRAGHPVSVAYDLDTALEWAAGTRFDLIVLNSKFAASVIDDALVKIRKGSPSAHSRIVAVNDGENHSSLDATFQEYLDAEDLQPLLERHQH